VKRLQQQAIAPVIGVLVATAILTHGSFTILAGLAQGMQGCMAILSVIAGSLGIWFAGQHALDAMRRARATVRGHHIAVEHWRVRVARGDLEFLVVIRTADRRQTACIELLSGPDLDEVVDRIFAERLAAISGEDAGIVDFLTCWRIEREIESPEGVERILQIAFGPDAEVRMVGHLAASTFMGLGCIYRFDGRAYTARGELGAAVDDALLADLSKTIASEDRRRRMRIMEEAWTLRAHLERALTPVDLRILAHSIRDRGLRGTRAPADADDAAAILRCADRCDAATTPHA